MAANEGKAVIYEKKGKIAYITLNRPDKMNAFNEQMKSELNDAWTSIRDDSDVFVAIVSGAGRCFSAGADIKAPPTPLNIYPDLTRGDQVRELAELSKPTIAACHSYVYGMGLDLVMSCDFRIAADNTRFGLPEALQAIVPVVVAARLHAYLPISMVLDMCLLGEDVTAEDAYRVGFIKKVVPQDELMPEAEALANQIADRYSPFITLLTKELIYRRLSLLEAEGRHLQSALSYIARQSEDYDEGRRAFAEKRKPEYKGR